MNDVVLTPQSMPDTGQVDAGKNRAGDASFIKNRDNPQGFASIFSSAMENRRNPEKSIQQPKLRHSTPGNSVDRARRPASARIKHGSELRGSMRKPAGNTDPAVSNSGKSLPHSDKASGKTAEYVVKTDAAVNQQKAREQSQQQGHSFSGERYHQQEDSTSSSELSTKTDIDSEFSDTQYSGARFSSNDMGGNNIASSNTAAVTQGDESVTADNPDFNAGIGQLSTSLYPVTQPAETGLQANPDISETLSTWDVSLQPVSQLSAGSDQDVLTPAIADNLTSQPQSSLTLEGATEQTATLPGSMSYTAQLDTNAVGKGTSTTINIDSQNINAGNVSQTTLPAMIDAQAQDAKQNDLKAVAADPQAQAHALMKLTQIQAGNSQQSEISDQRLKLALQENTLKDLVPRSTSENVMHKIQAASDARYDNLQDPRQFTSQMYNKLFAQAGQQDVRPATLPTVATLTADASHAAAGTDLLAGEVKASDSELAGASLIAGQRIPAAASGNLMAMLQINSQIQHPAWSHDMGSKLMFMIKQDMQQAQLQLNPQHLGPLEVRISIGQDQQVNVMFTSQHASVRDALDGAMTRLRDMLEEQGFSLNEFSVSDQAQKQHQESQAQKWSNMGTKSEYNETDEIDIPEALQGIAKHSVSDNLVDFFA